MLPENQRIVEVFVALGTQWRVIAGIGGVFYQGLDYTATRNAIELMGIDRSEWPEIFNGLRIMEAAAQPILNEKERS